MAVYPLLSVLTYFVIFFTITGDVAESLGPNHWGERCIVVFFFFCCCSFLEVACTILGIFGIPICCSPAIFPSKKGERRDSIPSPVQRWDRKSSATVLTVRLIPRHACRGEHPRADTSGVLFYAATVFGIEIHPQNFDAPNRSSTQSVDKFEIGVAADVLSGGCAIKNYMAAL